MNVIDGKVLKFNEDFTSFNTVKWSNYFPGNKRTHEENRELQLYSSKNVTVSNSLLTITAKRETNLYNSITYSYTSGLIQTAGKFSFTYGYVECRAKTTKGVGFWPTIWLLPVDGSWPPELDLLEQVGGVPDTNFMSVHWGSNNSNPYVQQTYQGPDFTADFHTYGMDWQKNYVTFYVDGVARAYYVNRYNVPNKPMYLIINLAIGGTATPPPNSSTTFPNTFQVDYVRVYQ